MEAVNGHGRPFEFMSEYKLATKCDFFVPGEPKAQPRPRAFARKMPNGQVIARVFDASTAEGWKSQVATAAKAHCPFPPFIGPLSVELHFFFSRPKAHYRSNGEVKEAAPYWHTTKPDNDNLAKAVMDALTTLGMWSDDKQVCHLTVSKSYQTRPGCQVIIEQLKPQMKEVSA